MPKGKKKESIVPEAKGSPEAYRELEREVKMLRELLKEEVDRSAASIPESQNVLVGMVGEQWIAVPLGKVVEVLPRVLLTPVPEAPAYVPGCMQWRGSQVPVIDLAARWGDPPIPIRLEDRIIVIDHRDQTWGLLVNQVDHLDQLSRQQIDPIPVEIPSAPFALGLWPYKEHSVLLLSIDHLIIPLEIPRT